MGLDRNLIITDYKRKVKSMKSYPKEFYNTLNGKVEQGERWDKRLVSDQAIETLTNEEMLAFIFKKYKQPKRARRKKGVAKKVGKMSSHKRRYYKYLESDEWAALKIDLYAARGRKCECCGSKWSLQVHHLTYENVFQEEPEDLIIVCRKCHEKEHGLDKKPKKKLNRRKNSKKRKPKKAS